MHNALLVFHRWLALITGLIMMWWNGRAARQPLSAKAGLLITPFDPDFAEAMTAYARGAKKFRNALRKLSR